MREVRESPPVRKPPKLLPRAAQEELNSLQTNLRELTMRRNAAFRIFATSRSVAIDSAQREFWLELAWLDQEYRYAVRRLAQFCVERRRRYKKSRRDPAAGRQDTENSC